MDKAIGFIGWHVSNIYRPIYISSVQFQYGLRMSYIPHYINIFFYVFKKINL